MLNILHLIKYPGQGSSEKYILSLAERLHKKSCNFYIGYSEEGPMLEQARALGVRTIHIPMKSPYDFRGAKLLKKVCKEYSIDVIHTHFLRENYVSILSKLMGNNVILFNTNHLLNRKNVLLVLLNSLITLAVDRIIAVSNAVKQQMIAEGIGPHKIEVVHTGIHADDWKGKRGYKLRKDAGIGRGDFLITCAAGFTEEEGHFFLIESVKMVNKLMASNGSEQDVRKIKFLLAGEGELLEECKKLSGMLGLSEQIFFMEHQRDIKTLLHNSDLYVSPRENEALGISILEALASDLPVVAVKGGGTSEIINGENNCGILVEYGDTEAMAKALIKFATDKGFYTSCKENAFKTVKEKFNLDKTVEETYNLYMESLTSGN